MRGLRLARTFEGILAWDSLFHLNHDDQRSMFGVFAAHASRGTFLMFNFGPAFGEAVGSCRGDPLYHSNLDAARFRGGAS